MNTNKVSKKKISFRGIDKKVTSINFRSWMIYEVFEDKSGGFLPGAQTQRLITET